jgi:hypothetical protein
MVGLAAIGDPPRDLPGVSMSVSYSRWALFAQPMLAVPKADRLPQPDLRVSTHRREVGRCTSRA